MGFSLLFSPAFTSFTSAAFPNASASLSNSVVLPLPGSPKINKRLLASSNISKIGRLSSTGVVSFVLKFFSSLGLRIISSATVSATGGMFQGIKNPQNPCQLLPDLGSVSCLWVEAGAAWPRPPRPKSCGESSVFM